MNNNEDPNDFLMSESGGGSPWAKWPEVGSTVLGTIDGKPRVRQHRDYESREPAFYPSGDPVLEIVIYVQTDIRDPEVEGDTGRRQIVARKESYLHQAIREAIKASGEKGVEDGGKLWIKRGPDSKEKNSKGMPFTARTFQAKYEAPKFAEDAEKAAMNALASLIGSDKPPF